MNDEQWNLTEFRRDINNYEIVSNISNGGFSKIYKIIDLNTNEELVAKTIFSSKTTNLMIYREIKIMIHFQSPTFIKFYGYSLTDFDGENNITLFMEYVKNQSLDVLLKKERVCSAPIEYDNSARQKILIGISYDLMFLHQNFVIHRDFTPDNILIDEYFCPKIIDFGLSKQWEEGHEFEQSIVCGKLMYMAPEVDERHLYGMKIDIYCFGLILYQIVSRKIQYKELLNKNYSNKELYNKIKTTEFIPEFDISVNENIKNLIL